MIDHASRFHQPHNSKRNYNYNAFVYTNTSYRAHFHSNYELIYVIEGEMPLTVNGIMHRLKAGELLLLNPYAIHAFEIKDSCRAWIGVFSNDHIPAYIAKYGKVQWSKFKCSDDIEALLKQALFLEGKPKLFLRIAYLYTVCNECVQNAEALSTENDHSFMQQVITYITEHIDGDVSLREISEHCGYEYHYFSALFHRCFFMNFKELLNIFRIERACELLMQDKDDVTSVYRQCGFSSIRNFNRVFLASVGCTPTEYRKSTKQTK